MAAPGASLHHSVPLSRTRLIGREAERDAARTFLLEDAVPLLTLTGPGGVGKTRLALAIGEAVTASFADGVIFVDLSPLADPSLVPTAVIAALEISPSPDRSLIETIVAALRREQRLLILDNCEHVLAVASELVAALLAGCPALQILATSRAPLHVRGEQVLPVPPLAVPHVGARQRKVVGEAPAVALFLQRARGAAPHFALTEDNAGAVAEICQRLDGLPLALELVAARASVLSPWAMLDLLNRRVPVLGAAPRNAPARHRTIQDAMAWSYALLPPRSKPSFGACASLPVGGHWKRQPPRLRCHSRPRSSVSRPWSTRA